MRRINLPNKISHKQQEYAKKIEKNERPLKLFFSQNINYQNLLKKTGKTNRDIT